MADTSTKDRQAQEADREAGKAADRAKEKHRDAGREHEKQAADQ